MKFYFTIFMPSFSTLTQSSLIFCNKENRLCAVARVLSATLDDSTGKFETLGSNFSNETRIFARLLTSIATSAKPSFGPLPVLRDAFS